MRVDLCSFYVPVLWTEETCVVRSCLPRRFAWWPSAVLSSVCYLLEVCANLRMYFLSNRLNWLTGPVEATSEKLKVKKLFPRKVPVFANHGRWLAKSLAKGSASDRPR